MTDDGHLSLNSRGTVLGQKLRRLLCLSVSATEIISLYAITLKAMFDIMALLDGVGVVQAFFVKEPPEIKPAQAITGWILNTRTI